MIAFNVPPRVGSEEKYVSEAIANHKICGDGPFTKKHGPKELRTVFVQRRCRDTSDWKMIQRYEYMKKNKGSGNSIVAAT